MTNDHELMSHAKGPVGAVEVVGDREHIAQISAGIIAIAERCPECAETILDRLVASEAMMMTLINMRVYVEGGGHAFTGRASAPALLLASFTAVSFVAKDVAQRRREAWTEIMRLCQSGAVLVEAERQGRQ